MCHKDTIWPWRHQERYMHYWCLQYQGTPVLKSALKLLNLHLLKQSWEVGCIYTYNALHLLISKSCIYHDAFQLSCIIIRMSQVYFLYLFCINLDVLMNFPSVDIEIIWLLHPVELLNWHMHKSLLNWISCLILWSCNYSFVYF